jgi:hypothetical protein
MRRFLKNKLKKTELGGMAHMVETFLESTWSQVQTPVPLKKVHKIGTETTSTSLRAFLQTLQLTSFMYLWGLYFVPLINEKTLHASVILFS